MYNIIKNICKILFKRKSFVFATFFLPIILIFGFSVLNSSNSTFSVAIDNKDNGAFGEVLKDRLIEIKGVKVIEIDADKDTVSDLIFHKYEMVVTVDKNFTEDIINGDNPSVKIKSLSEGETLTIISTVINSQVNDFVNLSNNINVEEEGIDKVIAKYNETKPEYSIVEQEEKKTSIDSSLGIIFYLIFVSASISCGFLLEDEREGTKDRVLMSKISEKSYYGGVCAIFFALSSIPAIEYYIICKLLNFEFGFKNSYLLLVLLLITVLLAVVFNILLSSIIKNKAVFSTIGSTITIPLFMLSGAFWPYDMMSETLQNVGSALPPRWFFAAVEKLQQGEGAISILPMISGLIIVTVFLFLLSIFFTRNKMVLVKDNK